MKQRRSFIPHRFSHSCWWLMWRSWSGTLSLRSAVVFAKEVMRQLERYISVLVLNYIEIQQSDTCG